MENKNVYRCKPKENRPKFKGDISIILWQKGTIHLSFHARGLFMIFEIYRMEWNGMMNFFRMTKNKNGLAKGREGYSYYDIKTGEVYFYNSKEELKVIEHLRNKDPIKWKRHKKSIEQKAKNIKKAGLDETVSLRYERLAIHFSRRNFIKFRNGCLSLKHSIKGRKLPGATIKFR